MHTLTQLTRITNGKTGRFSSWDTTGRNNDAWSIPAGESRVLADIKGPGLLTHLWLTQRNHYRECLLKITWDNANQTGPVIAPPPVANRMPVLRDNQGTWLYDPQNQYPGQPVDLNDEMKEMKARWAEK
jgi:hypothetical protein